MPVLEQVRLYIPKLHCGACVKQVEKVLATLLSDDQWCINLPQRELCIAVTHKQVPLISILQKLNAAGYTAYPIEQQNLEYKKVKQQAMKRIFVAGIGMMQVTMYAVAVYLMGEFDQAEQVWRHFFHLFSLLLTTLVVFYSGQPFLISAYQVLKNGSVNMDVPVALAIVMAYSYSVWATLSQQGQVYFDSVVMFIFLLSLGRYLELQARHKTGKATEALQALLPNEVTKLNADGSHQTLALTALEVGNQLLVQPGHSIPADGIIRQGKTSINEALLTGEALPQDKQVGDELIAGSVNGQGCVVLEVTRVGADTALSHIKRLLLLAQWDKPRFVQLADQLAVYFVVGVLGFAVLVGCCWFFIDPQKMLPIVVATLIVTCPCALSLATPATLTAAMGGLAQRGVLVTKGDALERLHKVKHFMLDKTGTLTCGYFSLVNTRIFAALDATVCLKIAAAMEQHSKHPLSYAFQGINVSGYVVTELETVPAVGLKAQVNGQTYWLGQANALGLQTGQMEQAQGLIYQPGATWLVLANTQQWLAAFEVKDQTRADSQAFIEALIERGLSAEIISGDTQQAVTRLAEQLSIERCQGEMSPTEKWRYLKNMKSDQQAIAMVGDGVNDGPVLAQANLGIAMGQGTALAKASADMIVTGNCLMPIVQAWDAAQKTRRLIKQNLLWALVYNITLLPLAALGWVPPWLAALGMSTSSLLVVLNATRAYQF